MMTNSTKMSDKGGLPEPARNFIHDIVKADVAAGKHGGRVVTRFPPEPNGYLHIGHAKSICLNFSLAADYHGACHLRFDDTNPTTENVEFVESIKNDVRWLGFDWHDKLFFASDYFERLYSDALQLIRRGKAYVCSLTEEQMRATRGTVTEPGEESPYRSRSVEENVDLFQRMRGGEFPDGAHTLRAKIDMANPNMKMRDPPLYRIRHAHHYRTGNAWPIYPMYDYAHCLSDAYEGVTHSICTLEFENNRELYDWIIEATQVEHQPKQYEFARLNLTYTVLSKRKLAVLVGEGHVEGWDDPRMPTLAGMRRRGIPPEAVRTFCARIGVAKANSTVDVGQLEFSVRDHLNLTAPRALAVLQPLRVVIENYPEAQVEHVNAPTLHPDAPHQQYRKLPFGREIYIEREDFAENPPKGYRRLTLGGEVRLRYAYFLRCHDAIKNEAGEVVELRCTYDPATGGGKAPDGRKARGIIHWVLASEAMDAEVRLYDRLFSHEKPDQTDKDFRTYLNSESLRTLNAKVEARLRDASAGDCFQFERHGYFTVDEKDTRPNRLVLNRTVSLKDTWDKVQTPREPAASTKPAPKAQVHATKAPARPKAIENPAAHAYFVNTLGLPPMQADILSQHRNMDAFMREAVQQHASTAAIANLVVNELLRELKDRTVDDLPCSGESIGELVALVEGGTISARIAKDVLAILVTQGGKPTEIVEQRGWQQLADSSAVERAVQQVLSEHQDAVEKVRAGKSNTIGFLMGKVMQATGGKANPKLVNEALRRKLQEPS